MTFTTNFQWLSLYLKQGEFLWFWPQIFNYYHPAWGGLDCFDFHCRFFIIIKCKLDFYSFYCRFSIIYFMALINSQSLSLCRKWVGVFWLWLQILNYYHPTKGGFDFYSFYNRFTIIITPSKTGLIFIIFMTDSQLLSP